MSWMLLMIHIGVPNKILKKPQKNKRRAEDTIPKPLSLWDVTNSTTEDQELMLTHACYCH